MSEYGSSVLIVERTSALRPLLKQIADEAANLSDGPPPMVAVRVPRSEHPLVANAMHRIVKRFHRSCGRPVNECIEPIFLKTVDELAQHLDHTGPMVINLATIANSEGWGGLQSKLSEARRSSLVLLVSEQGPDELLNRGTISSALRAEIIQTYIWPDASKRAPSMKRDYFLRYVSSKNQKVGEALEGNYEARLLLNEVFSLPERGTSIEEVLHYANAYLSHLENFAASKHPVEILAHFVTHVLDENRESTPPAQREGVNAA